MKYGELICPAGTPAALRTAVDAGADAVYCGFQNATNARNFPGLNFTPDETGRRPWPMPMPAAPRCCWRSTPIRRRASSGSGARRPIRRRALASMPSSSPTWAWPTTSRDTHPGQRLHLSVQAAASSPEAIRYYCEKFGVRRVVLPRILTDARDPAVPQAEIPCEIETFIFGNHGLMVEGRCSLTNYAHRAVHEHGRRLFAGRRCRIPARGRWQHVDAAGGFHHRQFRRRGNGRLSRPSARAATARPPRRGLLCLRGADQPQPRPAAARPDRMPGSMPSRSRAASGREPMCGRWCRPSGAAVDAIRAGREPLLADLVALTEGQKADPGRIRDQEMAVRR